MARPSKNDAIKKQIAELKAAMAQNESPKRRGATAKANAKEPLGSKPSALAVAPKLKAALAAKAKSKGLGNWKTLAKQALEVAAS